VGPTTRAKEMRNSRDLGTSSLWSFYFSSLWLLWWAPQTVSFRLKLLSPGDLVDLCVNLPRKMTLERSKLGSRPPTGVTRLGSLASPRMVPVDAAACRAYRDPGARDHS